MPTPRRNQTIAPRPKTAPEAFNEQINPLIPNTRPELPDLTNRVNQISQKDDTLRDFSIGLEDIDTAVFYYFDNVIKPYVIEDNNRVKVPVIYANPERFKSAQYDGNIRDKDGKIMFPVITIRKVDIEKVRTLGNKLDGNLTHNQYIFKQRYSKENQYDQFSVLLNRKPVEKLQVLTIPDYQKITYSCEVHVNNERDLNKIIEAISYASYSYWGDPKKFTFMAMIDSMPLTREVIVGENKKISATFNIILNGYIIPDTINKYMSYNPLYYSKTTVVFNNEVVTPVYQKTDKPISYISSQAPLVTNNNAAINTYMSLIVSQEATSIDIFTDRFYLRGVNIATAPAGIRATSKEDFEVTVNGQIVSSPDIVSITQIGPDVEVILAIEYPLKTTFEIVVKGKFN